MVMGPELGASMQDYEGFSFLDDEYKQLLSEFHSLEEGGAAGGGGGGHQFYDSSGGMRAGGGTRGSMTSSMMIAPRWIKE
jgi:hypothetical protein